MVEAIRDHRRDLTANFSDVNNAILRHTDLGSPRTTIIDSEKNLFLAETLDFTAAIEEDSDTRTPISEGAKTLELVLAVRESSETGRPVKVGCQAMRRGSPPSVVAASAREFEPLQGEQRAFYWIVPHLSASR